MDDDAEQHRRDDDGHGAVGGRAELLEREQREHRPTRAHAGRTSRRTAPSGGSCPSRQGGQRDGQHAHHGEAQDRVERPVPRQARRRAAARRPRRRRSTRAGRQAAGLLDECQLRGPPRPRPRPRRRGRRRTRRRSRCRRRRAPRRRRQRPGPERRCRANSSAAQSRAARQAAAANRRRRPRPPPSDAPISSSSTAPGPAPCAEPSAAAAPAIATRTTGVTMPSLRPLSTVIEPAHPGRDRGIGHEGAPSAASVGASAAPTSSASQTPSPPASAGGQAPSPASTVSGSAEAEQPHVDGAVRAQVVQRHPGGVGEQHPHQGDLGEELQDLGLDLRVQRGHVRQHDAHGDEDDRRGEVRALQSCRERAPAEERARQQEHGHHGGRRHGWARSGRSSLGAIHASCGEPQGARLIPGERAGRRSRAVPCRSREVR